MFTASALARELENCGVTQTKQVEYSRQLDIDLDQLWRFIDRFASSSADDSGYDQRSFSEHLQLFLSQPPGVDHRRVVAYRILFETIVAIDAASDASARSHLHRRLDAIHTSMQRAASQPNPDAEERRAFWTQDGQFHKAFCDASSLKSLSWVVDLVNKQCFDYGVPTSVGEMKATVEEHNRIIKAVDAPSLDEDEIFRSFRSHIERAYKRWFLMEQDQDEIYPRDLSCYPAPLQVFVDDVAREAAANFHGELPAATYSQIVARLQIQHDNPDMFVVYSDCVPSANADELSPCRVVKGAYTNLTSAVDRFEDLKLRHETVTGIQFQPALYD